METRSSMINEKNLDAFNGFGLDVVEDSTAEIGNGRPAAEQQGTGQEEDLNGYYELKGCKVVWRSDVQAVGDGGRMRSVVFEYKTKSGKTAKICADAWNDTIKYNEFFPAEWYDLSLRVGCRESRDGRWFPSVNVAYAHRLRVVRAG